MLSLFPKEAGDGGRHRLRRYEQVCRCTWPPSPKPTSKLLVPCVGSLHQPLRSISPVMKTGRLGFLTSLSSSAPGTGIGLHCLRTFPVSSLHLGYLLGSIRPPAGIFSPAKGQVSMFSGQTTSSREMARRDRRRKNEARHRNHAAETASTSIWKGSTDGGHPRLRVHIERNSRSSSGRAVRNMTATANPIGTAAILVSREHYMNVLPGLSWSFLRLIHHFRHPMCIGE